MTKSWLVVFGLFACGGSTPEPTGPGNSSGTPSPSREQVLGDVVQALAAGDADKLMTFGDVVEIMTLAADCPKGETPDATRAKTMRRRQIDEALASSKGWKIELISITNEADFSSSRHDRNATFIGKGGKFEGCTARVDLLVHQAEVKLRLTKGGETKETAVKLDLMQVGGRWFVVEIPNKLEDETSMAVAKMDAFSKQMCDCKDKACADKVNEDLSKWGTEMAKSAGARSERPDPELAKKAAEIMTRYTECMTKLMMAGADQP